ncbi:MAG: hypothetical protein Q8P77_00260 [Candidatus Veblenbacteria bacterium]|nr:hypothetical protein [Candidatus Veblenbacteria bacterium]
MSVRVFSKLKPIIGIVLLVGLLGVGLVSIWYMGHNTTERHGCVGLSAAAPPCLALADITECLRVHMGVLQAISQAVPTYVSQLLLFLVVAVVLWFRFKWRGSEPDALSRLRLRLQKFMAHLYVLPEKIGQWLILHEKRDPAPIGLVVLRVLPVSIT